MAKPTLGQSRKRFRGDDRNRLPAQKIEPYRLWFEFLKLASKDSAIQIDYRFYQSWGPISEADFDEWWSTRWRDLFSVDIGVRLWEPGEETRKSPDGALIISVPLYQDRGRILRQVSELLDEHGVGERLADMRQGQFRLSIGTSETGHAIHPSTRFLRNLSKVKLLLHLYRFWLEAKDFGERQRLEETAKRYCAWAGAWNFKIQRDSKRSRIEIPAALSEFVAYLHERGNRRRVRLEDLNITDAPNHRRQIARYIRKARRIAQNVGCGEFPGRYESE